MKHLICVLAMLGSVSAFAHEGKGKHEHPALTKEDREKMAKNHEQIAACLRSDKAVDECWSEMHKSMKDMESCPMMKDAHKDGHGDKEKAKDKK